MKDLQNSLDNKNTGTARLIHEDLLNRMPPDILREMALRRFEEIKAAGYDVPENVSVILAERKSTALNQN
jgi:hypothetical protein